MQYFFAYSCILLRYYLFHISECLIPPPLCISRLKIFSIVLNNDGFKMEIKLASIIKEIFIQLNINENDVPDNDYQQIKEKIDALRREMKKRWIEVHRSKHIFLSKYKDWLSKEVEIKISNEPKKTPGRKKKNFDMLSSPGRRINTRNLRDHSSNELCYAAQMNLRKEGRLNAAHVVKQAINDSVESYKKVKHEKDFRPYDGDKALALMIRLNLSRSGYQYLREEAIDSGANLYPSYKLIQEAKERCYPQPRSINEQGASVPMQSLLNHTASRITNLVEKYLIENKIGEVVLVGKYGFDGSSGQSIYKQTFTGDVFDESSIFIASFVPLTLMDKSKKIHIWTNPVPSSPIFCRPIKFIYKKETPELINEYHDCIGNEVKSLQSHSYRINEHHSVKITFDLCLTMIDGKVSTQLSEAKSASTCQICLAVPTEMNDLRKLEKRPIKKEMLKLGLSTLHCWIRCMEFILHVSYRLPFKKWQVRSENKQTYNDEKLRIQKEIRKQLGLNIDMPLPGGSGTSNDGNTARTFFKESRIVSEITKIDKTLIDELGIILRTMSSGFSIDPIKFKQYTEATLNNYLRLYPWFYLPVTVHKILIHGADVISEMLLPIGFMSEEAQETKNKEVRKNREHFTRKFSRAQTIDDLHRRLLVSSDPIISSLRHQRKKRSENDSIPKEVLNLLVEPNII